MRKEGVTSLSHMVEETGTQTVPGMEVPWISLTGIDDPVVAPGLEPVSSAKSHALSMTPTLPPAPVLAQLQKSSALTTAGICPA